MNRLQEITLKSFRKSVTYFTPDKELLLDRVEDPKKASNIIYNELISDSPIMISRFGANELSCLTNYLDVQRNERDLFKYIKGDINQWWWNKAIISNMHTNAGFFPTNIEAIEQFCQLMINDIQELDILGSWQRNEIIFNKQLENVKRIKLHLLDPFWSEDPWTLALENRKVLVIHPFTESIEHQYNRRSLIFNNKRILPEFDLSLIQAVQSIGGNDTPFENWFEALNYMKLEIEKKDFDICLIGAGAYGMPLAAHVKRLGKKAIHLGGSLQLLFGIRGKRWENNYNSELGYADLMNDNWIRPNRKEIPFNAGNVEKGCYW